MAIEVYPDSQLGDKSSLIDSMLLGENVCTLADGAFYADYGVPDFGIVFGPFLFDNWDQCWTLIESDWYKAVSYTHLDVYKRQIQRIREKGYYEEHEIARNIRRMDRERRDYHRYYTGKEWENVENYDMMLNSGVLGTDGCVECILSYLKIRGLYPA